MPKKKEKAEAAQSAAARGMWSGTISFGLVSVPVSLFPALRRRPVHLRMLSADGTPLERQYYCPAEGKVLGNEDIVRGYELDDGKQITVRDEELEELLPEKTSDISLKEFVDVKDIPAFYYDRPYFLAPSGKSTKAYQLLAHVMEQQHRAGIATFVMRDREYLVAILSEAGLLMAETLRFAEEIRSPERVGLPKRQEPNSKLLNEFKKTVSSLGRKSPNENELSDEFARRLQKLVQKKQRLRKQVVRIETEEEEEGKIIDLVEVFKQRMREARAQEEGEAEPRRRAG